MKELIKEHSGRLAGKVVVDPSNPIAVGGDGQYSRTLPDGVTSASVIAGVLPSAEQLLKAFGTIGGDSLAASANRTPDRVGLFYATDETRVPARPRNG
jgi:8-hydroxy-5-deazaflavin:NADPH oxidoreductase